MQKISNTGHITGPSNWTLFLRAKNFNGPVVYWVPEAWSNISKNYSPANGRTLDSQPKLSEYPQSMANEINTVYMFQTTKQDGKIYSRIPKLKFPSDSIVSLNFFKLNKSFPLTNFKVILFLNIVSADFILSISLSLLFVLSYKSNRLLYGSKNLGFALIDKR